MLPSGVGESRRADQVIPRFLLRRRCVPIDFTRTFFRGSGLFDGVRDESGLLQFGDMSRERQFSARDRSVVSEGTEAEALCAMSVLQGAAGARIQRGEYLVCAA